MHLSAIPLGEMRTCTFCGSRLRAWYLLVGDPYKPSFATVTGRGDNPRYIYLHGWLILMVHVGKYTSPVGWFVLLFYPLGVLRDFFCLE